MCVILSEYFWRFCCHRTRTAEL